MKPRNKNFPPCPDCGGPVVSNGCREGTTIQRYQCVGEGDDPECRRRFTDNTKDKPSKAKQVKVEVPTKDALSEETHVYLFTYAQNATPVHEGFWNALQGYARFRNADLNVIQGRYRNPTMRNETADDEYWVDEVLPYLWNKRADICDNLQILGDMRVQPTAIRPLTRLDSITGKKSGILGHPKLELRTVPTPQADLPKLMLTTGACTVQNYSDSKAGKMGDFHHTIGAVVVEVRGELFHVRHLNAMRDGSFIDLDLEFLPDGSYQNAPPAEALIMGDWHSGFTSPEVIEATFGPDGITEVVRPLRLFWHDLLDQYSRNHHHKDNPFIAVAKVNDNYHNRDNLMEEVAAACAEVREYTKIAQQRAGQNVVSYIVASNHDEALTRYIKERNWKNDPKNAEFYLKTALKIVEEAGMTDTGASYPDAFEVWARELVPEATMLGRRQSLMVQDIECGMHGDIGPNGARGSAMNIAKIGTKTVIGHSHTPNIIEGCYQVGTSTHLGLEYARGPSSWLNTHCVIYANGKRALINIMRGEWKHD